MRLLIALGLIFAVRAGVAAVCSAQAEPLASNTAVLDTRVRDLARAPKLSRAQKNVASDVIVPRLRDRPSEMVVTAWCENCPGLPSFLRRNGIEYTYAFIHRDSPELAVVPSKLSVGTQVLRIPFHKPMMARRSVAKPMCNLIARAIEAENGNGGCVAVTKTPVPGF